MHSLRSVSVISGVLGRAGERGQQRRAAASAKGQVPWETPVELNKHIADERAQANKQRKRLKEMLAHTQGLNEEEIELAEQQNQRRKLFDNVNEDAMLDMLGQAATGKKPLAAKAKAKSPGSAKVGMSTSGVDKQLDASSAQAQQLASDIAALTLNNSTDDIAEQLDSQLAQAKQVKAGNEAAGSAPVAEETLEKQQSDALKKRKALDALFSGKTKL